MMAVTRKKWSLDQIPDMSGKTAVISGGNTGLGFKTALELARRGADVTIGSRSAENGQEAVRRILAGVPHAKISYGVLELTNPASIDSFARDVAARYDRLDILFHNAGLVIHPDYVVTETGQELQMQINYLGHYALTARLMNLIKMTNSARIVQSTTVPYQKGNIDFEDFDWANRKYEPMQAYFDSRLAQLLFAHALNERFDRAKLSAKVIPMQPGLVATEGLKKSEVGGWLLKVIAQPLETGCRTHLRACTDVALKGDMFLEPKFVLRGRPVLKKLKPEATDTLAANRLLALSETLTRLSLGMGENL